MPISEELVLLVDDDPNVLRAYERRLRRRFHVETALCSEEGLTAVNFLGPFAVIVSDMAMPRENGAEFLARMCELSPESVRIMLTGNADQATAVEAVNRGRVFRFLNKPCRADELERAIEEGIAEYRRLAAMRDVMAQTITGVVSMLTRVLSLVNPTAFGRATRLRTLASEVALAAEIDEPWRVEIAAALSQLGAVTLTEETLAKLARDEPLDPAEGEAVDNQYATAASLIGEAPRLEGVARLVAMQADGPESWGDEPETLARDAALLHATLRFDHLTGDLGVPKVAAVERLQHEVLGDPLALAALKKVVAKHDSRRLIKAGLDELLDGMLLVEDVATDTGMVLVTKGHDVTASLRRRLVNYSESHRIALPIAVLATEDQAQEIESARAALA